MGLAYPSLADGATLAKSAVALSDPRPSATGVNYTFTGGNTGGLVSSTNIQCVKVVIANTATGDTAPAGFNGSSATVTAASSTLVNSTATNWSLATSDGTSSSGQKNVLKYTNSAGGITPSTTTGATFILAGLVNPSTPDTAYWYHLDTYDNINCSSSPVDTATVEFINTNGSTLSLTIDNTLSFSVNALTTTDFCSDTTTHPTQNSTATTIPFGTVTSAADGIVCQDLQAASNSTNGYTIYLRYDHAPTNALAQTITDWSGSNATPTTGPVTAVNAQGGYGYATDDATLGTGTTGRFSGGNKYAAATASNQEVGYEATGVTATHYKVTHEVAITATTQPGTYTNTIIYTCTPVY